MSELLLDEFLDAKGFILEENLTGSVLCDTYIKPLGRDIAPNKYAAIACATVKPRHQDIRRLIYRSGV